jgi:hypothetical protein
MAGSHHHLQESSTLREANAWTVKKHCSLHPSLVGEIHFLCYTALKSSSNTNMKYITLFTASDVTLVAIQILCDDIQYVHIYKNFIWISLMTTALSMEGLIMSYKQVSNTQKRSSFDHSFLCMHNFSLPGKIISLILTFSAPFLLCTYPFHT